MKNDEIHCRSRFLTFEMFYSFFSLANFFFLSFSHSCVVSSKRCDAVVEKLVTSAELNEVKVAYRIKRIETVDKVVYVGTADSTIVRAYQKTFVKNKQKSAEII